jgi:predicted phosphodiesterase
MQLSEAQLREALDAHTKHGTSEAAAKALGLNVSTFKHRLRSARANRPETKEVRHLEDSGLKAENARLRAELTGGNRLPVETRAIPPIEIADLWRAAEEDNARRIDHSNERHKFSLKLDGPLCVAFISDQHISIDNTVDMRRMREDAELIAETDGAYVILGGDGIDNHVKHSSAILAARSQPHEQWRLYEHYLSIFAPKIIAMIDGNHDKWTDQIAGIDMVSWIAKQHRLHYAPDEARIDLTVGKVLYRLAVRHQYRFNSSLNLLHTVKRWWAHGELPFDIGCIGHHHEAAIESFRFHGLQLWGCRPGSYQITSGYSRQYGFNATVPRAPSFILFPDERRILGFPDIRDALKTLKAER